MQFSFTKWHGCGNDFVLVNGFKERVDNYADVSIKVCDRHFGIGADGLIMLLPSDKADIGMRIFNADGSEAEMCGNGIRCLARFARLLRITDKDEFTVETGAGILKPRIADDVGPDMVAVDMGMPVLDAHDIPVDGMGDGRVIDKSIIVCGKEYHITCVSMGNPHAVVFVDDVESFPLDEIGPRFETHHIFPRKTNTEFVEVVDRTHLRMRVWERGSGITLACGTGACATLTAAVLNGYTEKKAEVRLDGGTLVIEWKSDGHIEMTGPAVRVYSGSIDL